VLARARGRLATRTAARRTQSEMSTAGTTSGSAALDALELALQDTRWHGARVHVQLSNSLVRYAIVPASAHLLGAADETALTLLKIQQVHGGASEDWDIRLGNLLSGKDQICAALERSFIQRLRQILQRADLRLCSLEPFLMRSFNRVRHQIAGREFWFAQAEPGLLILARMQGGNWASLAAVPLSEPLEWVLPTQVREAQLRAGGADFPRRVYLYAPGMDCAGCQSNSDLDIVDLAKTKTSCPTAADLVKFQAGAGLLR